MARRPQRRKTKKVKTKTAPKPASRPQGYQAALGSRAKQVAARVLDVAENDPERFVEGIKSLAQGVEALYKFAQTNPGEAKRTLRNAALAAAARAAKSKLV